VTIGSLQTTTTPNDIAKELAAVAEQLRSCTVQVRSSRSGGGSGVIWHSDGLIITNAHVAQTETATVELSDGRVFDAVRTSIDRRWDLAALQIKATDLKAATVGDANALRVGELVLAVGNPLGVVGAVTTGIIHSIGSADTLLDDEGAAYKQWVMADIRLAPGNSGGSLADAQGRVIGINTMIAAGLALAVPSNVVERFLQEGSRPYLGVTMRPLLVQLGKRHLGLLVLEVANNSLAQASGILPGDVLIGVFGQYFHTPDDLLNVLWHAEPGEVLPLEFLRFGKRHHCDVIIPGGNIITGVKSP
jgi:serine protease Do